MKAGYIRLAAFAVYAISFFMPAARLAGAANRDALSGWMCAWMASVLGAGQLTLFFRGGFDARELLLPASGLVNYLFVAVCVLSFWQRFRRARLVLGALMMPCFAATWVFFATSHTTPLAGHFVWIAACVLVVIPDLFVGREEGQARKAEAADGYGNSSAGA
jgi:hypothetical protein